MNYKALASLCAILVIAFCVIYLTQSEPTTKSVVIQNETQTNGPVMVTGANQFAFQK